MAGFPFGLVTCSHFVIFSDIHSGRFLVWVGYQFALVTCLVRYPFGPVTNLGQIPVWVICLFGTVTRSAELSVWVYYPFGSVTQLDNTVIVYAKYAWHVL